MHEYLQISVWLSTRDLQVHTHYYCSIGRWLLSFSVQIMREIHREFHTWNLNLSMKICPSFECAHNAWNSIITVTAPDVISVGIHWYIETPLKVPLSLSAAWRRRTTATAACQVFVCVQARIYHRNVPVLTGPRSPELIKMAFYE